MKKNFWFALIIFSAFGLAINAQADENRCTLAYKTQSDILSMGDQFSHVQGNRTDWRTACFQLADISTHLPAHQKLLKEGSQHFCGGRDKKDRELCTQMRRMSNYITTLKNMAQDACRIVSSQGAFFNPESAAGFSLSQKTSEALSLITQKMIPSGTILLKATCGKDAIFLPAPALNAQSNIGESREYGGNGNRAPETAIIIIAPPAETSAGTANTEYYPL